MPQRAKTRQGSGVSLKKQILEWWAALPEPTTRQVADLCNCHMAYVRVVVRQRGENGLSDHDRAYRQRFIAENGVTPERHRYHANPDSRAKMIANNTRWCRRKAEDDPAWARARARVRRQWVITKFGSEWTYKKLLRARRTKSSKERL
jgi:hypothetical protein